MAHHPRRPVVPMEQAERQLLDQLLDGDEAAFEALVARYQERMRRLARVYVRTDAQAEDVVQETWLAVLRGLSRFERRSSLRTWMFQILANRARTHAVREGRLVPFAESRDHDGTPDGPTDGFDEHGRWREAVAAWPETDPERLILSRQIRQALDAAIQALPDGQRLVVILRDIEGLTASDACNVLAISETNQRVLLHRGRTRLRAALASLTDRERR